jgi:hypothetical protein
VDLRSIETRRHRRRDGTVLTTHRVRWTGPTGRRKHRSFDRLESAVEFRDELDRRAALIAEGPAGRRTKTIADCYALWMREHVLPELATRTQLNYRGVWERHLADRVGGELAIGVRPRHVNALRGDMLADGLGPQTVRKALQVLGHLFSHALELDIVEVNPVPQIRKPRAGAARHVEIVEIATVERMRWIALHQERSPLTSIAGAALARRPGDEPPRRQAATTATLDGNDLFRIR